MSSKLEDGSEIPGNRCVASLRFAKRDHNVSELGRRFRSRQNQGRHELLSVRACALAIRELDKPI